MFAVPNATMMFLAFASLLISRNPCYASSQHQEGNNRTIWRYAIHEDGLSILSIRRNLPGMVASEWVEKFFGPNAIYKMQEIPVNTTFPNGTSSSTRLPKPLRLPDHAIKAKCSFELLGFVRLNDKTIFSHYNRKFSIFGVAPMVIAQSSVAWTCYYRTMSESWRVSKSYWPVFFYCPAPNNAVCNGHEMITDSRLKGQLQVRQFNTTWKSRFPSNVTIGSVKPAACLAIPYKSSDPQRAVVNGAMIYEWTRYYSLLGFRVFVYDKDGANRDYIFKSAYGMANRQQGKEWLSNVVYIPHTVTSLLQRSHAEVKYDSAIAVNASNHAQLRNFNQYLDDDKSATLTHCRFEASALYGSHNVLVADSDEFLFCPNGASTFAGQRHFIHTLLAKYTAQNVDQMIYTQLTTAAKLEGGKYSSVLDCLTDKVQNGKSLFECYAGYEYNTGFMFQGKAIHLGHKCPFTDFHSSSTVTECKLKTVMHQYNQHDYKVIPAYDHCSFMHLSTHPRDYDPPQYRLSNKSRLIFEATPSELSLMVNRKDAYARMFAH